MIVAIDMTRSNEASMGEARRGSGADWRPPVACERRRGRALVTREGGRAAEGGPAAEAALEAVRARGRQNGSLRPFSRARALQAGTCRSKGWTCTT